MFEEVLQAEGAPGGSLDAHKEIQRPWYGENEDKCQHHSFPCFSCFKQRLSKVKTTVLYVYNIRSKIYDTHRTKHGRVEVAIHYYKATVFIHNVDVFQYYLKVDYYMLNVYIARPRAATKKKFKVSKSQL